MLILPNATDGFRFARRISSFDKDALTEAKKLVNRSFRLADDALLDAAGTAFVKTITRPSALIQTHVTGLATTR
jgi:hypothetical protein